MQIRVAVFRALGKLIHTTSVEKGFYEPPVEMDKAVAKLALIHSEVTEVLEALRKSKGADAVTEEFADILIRTFDLHTWLIEKGLATDDLDDVFNKKMKMNRERPARHGHRWG